MENITHEKRMLFIYFSIIISMCSITLMLILYPAAVHVGFEKLKSELVVNANTLLVNNNISHNDINVNDKNEAIEKEKSAVNESVKDLFNIH